jgi:hypothetical protein
MRYNPSSGSTSCLPRENDATVMKRIVDKAFIVRVPLPLAWNHLAEIEKWPSWAKHIRSVVKSPPGPLCLATQGTLRLSNGVKTAFRMTEFEPLKHWKWVGKFLGATIFYDHIFTVSETPTENPGGTTIRFVVDAEGWSLPLVGGIFARIYRKNRDRAVPLLIREIEARK